MVSGSRPQNKAFSLLELVIAVGILSIGITVVLQAFSFAARLSGLSCDMIDAALLAEDKIQELEFKERQNLISAEPKEVRGSVAKFEWEYSLRLVPDLNLYNLDFKIKWKRLNQEEKIDLNTYLRL